MHLDSSPEEGTNWWVVGAFTTGGLGLLAAAYYLSAYWQGVLVNGGTSLCLFALLVLSEPRLLRHLREPQSLDDALARFVPRVTPFQAGDGASSAQSAAQNMRLVDEVLRTVRKSGLTQEPPGPSSVRFRSLAGSAEIEWDVAWDDKGVRHSVRVNGRNVPSSLSRPIDWEENLAVHKDRIFRILCYLLRGPKGPRALARVTGLVRGPRPGE